MKRIKLSLFIIFSIVIILKGKDFIVNYIELKEAKNQSTQLKEEYDKSKKDLENVLKGDNKEKYFRQEYKISDDGDILFVFPDEEDSSSS